MAKYRQLYTEFWSDGFVLELTPEEKYFYLYLISNSRSTQCGIYEISKRTIETDTGYNRETVEKLIQRFCDYKKILYCEETRELMVINWIKYNVPSSLNTIKCVQKELFKIKNKAFVKILFNKCQELELDVDKIFENFKTEDYSEIKIKKIEGAYKPLVSKEVISKKEVEEVIKVFEESVHAITPLEYEKILEFTNHVTVEVIILAIEEAVKYDAKTMKYISKILSCWISLGIKTGDEAKLYQKKWASKNTSSNSQNLKKGGFCDYDQRTYDFDALEKKLLGHLDNVDFE